jgi:uncharacterized membrane protein
MPSLSQAKSLGAVGSILVVLTAVPGVGALLGIVGFILTLVAVKYISDIVSDRSIFNNMLIAIALAIAGIVVGALVVIGTVMNFVGLAGMTGPDYFGQNFNPSTVPTGDWVGLVLSILGGLAAVWVILLISAIFVRKSYSSIASKLNVSMFRTAGLVYLIGAATTIFLVGFLILLIAQILLIVAFFSIQDRTP